MKVIVLGGGTAGAVLAARLSELEKFDVTLLEAGPDYSNPQDLPADLRDGRQNSMTAHDWGFDFQPTSQRSNRFSFPRGRVLGGSGAVNTCIALRGLPDDYDEWARRGISGWGFSDCLPHFKRAENDLDFDNEWHAQSGPIPIRRHPPSEWLPWQAAFVEASLRAGYSGTVDHNNPELPSGVGPHAMNKVGGERMSSARCYLTPQVRRRRNLNIVTGSHIDRLNFSGGRFRSVTVLHGRQPTEIFGDRAVLCAGALGSVGVLLRSGIGPHRELGRLAVATLVDSPTVGARLLDHPGTAVLFAPHRGIEVEMNVSLLQVMTRTTSTGSRTKHDLQLQPGSWLPLFGLDIPVFAIMAAIGKPDGHGTIRFATKDPRCPPTLEGRFLDHPADRAKLEDAAERIWHLARQPEIASMAFPIVPNRATLCSRDDLRSYLPIITGSGYHPCGTVPMGDGRIEHGALDAAGRLLGVSGVMVADASIFPTIPTANINLPTVMAAEKLARQIQSGIDF